MNTLRTTAVIVSLAAHVGAGFALAKHVNEPDFAAFEAGAGQDQFVVEQGIGLNGIVKLGEDMETIRTADVTPVETVTPPPVMEERKEVDELQETITSKSVTAVEDNIIKTEDPPPLEVKPQEVKPVEAVEPPIQVAIAKDASSGREQRGGDAGAAREYHGKLAKRFSECLLKTKKMIGSAEVRIVVDDQGQMVKREIVNSSGNSKLDDAALANVDYAIKDCKDEALPKAPEGLTENQRTLRQRYTFE